MKSLFNYFLTNSKRATTNPIGNPINCAIMKIQAESIVIPANESLQIRANVTAGFAKTKDEVA